MLKTMTVRTTIAAILAGLSMSAHAIADTARPFNVPAGDLVAALESLSRQADIELVYQAEQLRGIHTAGVNGTYEPKEAVTLLLKGTRLTIRTDDATGVMLVAPPTAPKTSEVSRGEVTTGESENSPQSQKRVEVEEVVVTGTHIRGVAPISPTMTFSQQDLHASGYTRLDTFIDQLPQNFSGGGASQRSNPIPGGGGSDGSRNYSFASGINLRGLGSDATLVLLNGHRLPETAQGTLVDISRIPVSAIDRVEILTDGASATYGADAVAGVANIITRSKFEGLETGVRLDSAADGKTPNYGAHALAGHSWTNGHGLISFDYQRDNPLYARNRTFSADLADGSMLLPRIETSTFLASGRQQLSSDTSVGADAYGSRRSFFVTYDAFGTASRNSGDGNQFGINGDIQHALSTTWNSRLSLNLANADENNTINQGLPNKTDYRFRIESADLQLDGAALELPAGELRTAFGAAIRREQYRSNNASHTTDTDRRVHSAYGELQIPVIGASGAITPIHSLRASASGRYDHYDDFGSASTGKLSVELAPTETIRFHGSYGTAFRAPALSQMDGGALQFGYVYDFPDPSTASGVRRSLFLDDAGNPDLKAERSRSITFGVSYRPQALGVSADLSYFDVRFRDKVVRLSDHGLLDVLLNASQYGGYLNLDPTVAEVSSALAIPTLTVIDFNGTGYNPGEILAIARLGYTNAALVHPKGFDGSFKDTWTVGGGELRAELGASYFVSYDSRFTPAAPALEGINRVGAPPRFRGKFEMGWRQSIWAGYARLNYTNAYTNELDTTCGAAEGCDVASISTVDAGIVYRTVEGRSGAALSLALDVLNVFDRSPPFVRFVDAHYDGANANPLQRAVALRATSQW